MDDNINERLERIENELKEIKALIIQNQETEDSRALREQRAHVKATGGNITDLIIGNRIKVPKR